LSHFASLSGIQLLVTELNTVVVSVVSEKYGHDGHVRKLRLNMVKGKTVMSILVRNYRHVTWLCSKIFW